MRKGNDAPEHRRHGDHCASPKSDAYPAPRSLHFKTYYSWRNHIVILATKECTLRNRGCLSTCQQESSSAAWPLRGLHKLVWRGHAAIRVAWIRIVSGTAIFLWSELLLWHPETPYLDYLLYGGALVALGKFFVKRKILPDDL